MLKRILCLAVLAACVLTASSCSVIDSDPSAAAKPYDTGDASASGESGPPKGTAASDVNEDGWGYSFGSEFIDENGIGYIWDSIDEDTRYNLGEVMNAIRNVRIYCPLTVGFPKEETQNFLELISNCSTFYTYSSGTFRFHYDESGRVKGLTIGYSVNYEDEAVSRSNTLNNAIEEIISQMPKDAGEFDKIRYLHDNIVLNCEYSEDGISPFTAFGAIVEHKAACQGYADGLTLLLSRAGFEVMFATGRGEDIKHKWCYVRLSDGNWYAIDPTWDDLQGEGFGSDYIGYNYFLVSDEWLLKDHPAKNESSYYRPPTAESMNMNFYRVMGYTASNADTAFDVLKNQARKAADEGKRYLYLMADDPGSLEEIYDELASGPSGNNRMEDIITAANSAAGGDVYAVSWVKSLDPVLGTLIITLKYNE